MAKNKELVSAEGNLVSLALMKIKELQKDVRIKSKDLMLIRFEQICFVQDLMEQRDEERYNGIVKKIAFEMELSPQYVSRIYTWAGYFNFNKKALESDMKKNPNASLTYYLKEFANPDQNPKAIGGKENDKQRLLDLAEKGSEALKKAAELYPDDPEVVGVVTAYYEDITDEEGDAEFIIGNPQKAAPIGFYAGESGERIEDIEYLEWLRACPCCITGAYGNIDVNHIRQKGRDRNNASDYMALPFNRDLHTGNPKSFHRMKFDEFEEYWSKKMGKEINLRKFVFQHLQKYIIHLRGMAKF